MKPFAPPPAAELLAQLVAAARQDLMRQATPKKRFEMLWHVAVAARDLASQDVWAAEFKRLADELGLTAHRKIRRDGIEHVLRWAWLERNPFR
jgi:isopentenyldiphosphate isomerase